MRRIGGRLAAVGALWALSALASAAPSFGEVVKAGWPVSFEASVAPKVLPRSKPVPAQLGIWSSTMRRGDGAAVDLNGLRVELGLGLSIRPRAVPACTARRIRNLGPATLAACVRSRVGSGWLLVSSEIEDAPPVRVHVELYDGGGVPRRASLSIYALSAVGETKGLVGSVRFRSSTDPRFPAVARIGIEGAALRGVVLKLGAGYVAARCPNGALRFRFDPPPQPGGEPLEPQSAARPCTYRR